MKKNLVYIFLILLTVNNVEAQVGVNTSNPQGSFHVDGSKDNLSNISNQKKLSNDLIIEKNTSNIGLGNLPENNAKVSIGVDVTVNSEIGKGFRLLDGSQGNGNVLSILNNQGDIVWKNRISTVIGKLGVGYAGRVDANVAYTESYIDLPPGKWLIRSSIILRVSGNNGTYNDGLFAQLAWADKNSDGSYVSSIDAESGNLFGGAYLGVYSLAFGQTIINNTSSTTKTYYLIAKKPKIWGTLLLDKNWVNLGASTWGENAVIAFAAN